MTKYKHTCNNDASDALLLGVLTGALTPGRIVCDAELVHAIRKSALGQSDDIIIDDELYKMAVAHVITAQRPSISYIQRKMAIGYNMAAIIIERMTADGLISAPDENNQRHIIKK